MISACQGSRYIANAPGLWIERGRGGGGGGGGERGGERGGEKEYNIH